MLHTKLKTEAISAMKNGEKVKLMTIRGILTNINNNLIENKKERDTVLNDDEVLKILKKLAKQREDSIGQYKTAKREDLVDQEQKELNIIKQYMPELINGEELEELVKLKIKELDINEKKDIGKLMSYFSNSEYKNTVSGRDVVKILETSL